MTSWLSEKSTWLWTTQLLPLQNIQFLTAWLPEDCFEKECSLPDFLIVRNLNLNKSEYQISGCMFIRNSVQHGTEPAFSDSNSARYLPLSHEDPPKTSRQLSSVQLVWHHCDSWGAWCVRNWIGICYFAPVLDTYNWKLVPYTLTQLTLHFATRQDRESSLFTGRCIVAS